MSSSKRVLLTVLICTGILFAWSYLFNSGKQEEKTGTPKQTKQESQHKTHPESLSGESDVGKGKSSLPKATQKIKTSDKHDLKKVEAEAREKSLGLRSKNEEGKLVYLNGFGAKVTFTSRGAALRSWKLEGDQFREQRNGILDQVDLVNTQGSQGLWPLVTTFSDSDFEVPADAEFKVSKKTSREILYLWESDRVRLSKHFFLDSKRPLVWLTLKVKNLTQFKLNHRLKISLYNRPDPNQAKASFTNPYPRIPTVQCHVNGELMMRSIGAITGEDSGCTAAGCGMGEGSVSKTGEILWIGSGDRYFLLALVPLDKQGERRCELEMVKDQLSTIHSQLFYPQQTLEPHESKTWRFVVYSGSKNLAALDSVICPDGTHVRLGDSVEFGWLAVLCRPMLWLMELFHSLLGNWGVAIILLTVFVKLLTFYPNQKSMRSMKQMQRLKPKMDELRERYKDDKERLNQEMMSLYKVHKVNPLGGCLPMLIQFPIWFALYKTLGNAVELYRSSFVGWITDLTAPDPYYVLPIAMGISMYAQQAITPQPMEGTQAKVMKYFMPGMFTVMMLALPSGLTLYIFVNTLLTMIQQWYMNKSDPIRDANKPKPKDEKVKQAPKLNNSRSEPPRPRATQRPRNRRRRRKVQ